MKHGVAFGEHIKTEKINRRKYDEVPHSLKIREYLPLLALLVATLLLLGKLVTLQIFQGSYYSQLADSNRIRTYIIPAPRGVIFDRNGKPLVYNTPGFRQILKDNKVAIISKDEALAKIAKGERNIGVASLRQYPYKDAMNHVLGYIGQISAEELKSAEFANYHANEWLGKSGIERTYEYLLRGTDGKQLIEVDAMGKTLRSLGQTDPFPGQDITLTIDAPLQQAAFDATSEITKGAVIASTPDGQILAMVSRPSFDPNLFTLDDSYLASSTSAYADVSEILMDGENQPFLNRAIGGVYPPGSTFKLITAAAGLESEIIDEKYSVVDTGVLKIGEFSFANWFYTSYGKTEPGAVNVIKAISRSNDIFFYKLAEKITVDKLSAMAKKFKLGQTLGIDLDNEATGLVPTKEWKEKTIKEKWYLGDTYHFGIGQGYLLTTPLQVNAWTQAIAHGGTLVKPHFLQMGKSQVLASNLLSPKTIDVIRRGMIDSCATGGVAWPFFDFKVKNAKLKVDGKSIFSVSSASGSADMRKVVVACKTGTSQHGGEDTLPHSWITLFAPAHNPTIVLTVLAESSGEGSNVAGPVARKVLEAYFSNLK